MIIIKMKQKLLSGITGTSKNKIVFFRYSIMAIFFLLCAFIYADDIRVLVKDNISISTSNPEGITVPVSYNDAALISLTGDTRFICGIELELTAPQLWLPNQGSLSVGIYGDLDSQITGVSGINNIETHSRRLKLEPLPAKIQNVYQIPLRTNHGLRNTPYVSVLQDVILPHTFPVLFRIAPIAKELGYDIENMRFMLNVKPIFSDEGIVHIKLKYADAKEKRYGPVAILIDNKIVEDPLGDNFLSEGEHFLTILSTDYRTENRRFIVERTKVLELSINLRDLSPTIVFEAPARSLIYIDGNLVSNGYAPLGITPGIHEVKIQVSDYTIVKTLNIQKGKTYHVSLNVDLDVTEE
ncbi:hypothetical protein FACS1894102_4910 [Spirochaetia bacterium]|nr:hypothetical protein FACS1894102_4910 [Spirochaetia bacterium]